MTARSSSHTVWLLAILLGYLLLAIAFSIVVPIYEAPDELQHAFYVKQLADGKGLPVLDVASGRPWHEEGFPPRPYTDVWSQEGGQPPLYYAVGAILVASIDTSGAEEEIHLNPHANIGEPLLLGNKNRTVHPPSENWPWRGMPAAVHLLRFYSILLGLGTVYLVYRLTRLVIPGRPTLALAATAFVAFLPQFLYISAAVSNDNLIILLSTLMLWLLLRAFGNDLGQTPGWRQATLLGLVLGLALLAKMSSLNLLLLTVGVFFFHAFFTRRWRSTIGLLLITLLVAAVIGAWWYVRNWLLYGDPTAFGPFLAIVGERPSPLNLDNFAKEMEGLRISLLALFGWFNIPVADWIYLIWDLFLLAAGAGLLLGLWRRLRDHSDRSQFFRQHLSMLVLLLWLILLTISLIRWTEMTPGTQGRLLFPAIAPLALFLMLGWAEWLPGRRFWPALPPAGLLLLTVSSLLFFIRPAYQHPPLITQDDIPAQHLLEPVVNDNRILLLGGAVTPATIHRGEPFDLTVYWQATEPVPYNASMFVHLLGRDYEQVGQFDTYPGWGNYATSLWQPGSVVQDDYQFSIPWEVETPTLLQVDVGLFDYETRKAYSKHLVSGDDAPLGIDALRVLPGQAPTFVITSPEQFRYDSRIHLEGFDIHKSDLHSGDTLDLTLYWQGMVPIEQDYQVFVHLMDENWQQVAGADVAPRAGWWPTSAWEPNQLFDDEVIVALPEKLPTGRYTVIVGLYQLDTVERLPVDGPADRIRDRAALLTTIEVRP